ncbi:hypothetical protein CALCODRAFT_282629 [Calocera cornea HHB12733]|uniref:Uncharacterized protein n=1 Tax=Calocera cornea HHB12733 TaxID=1353952 RepID=A0A165FYR1_9BASI|nr:hypothetical protein CALCODRAFT_282629 [Calocera cornea HHB12733]
MLDGEFRSGACCRCCLSLSAVGGLLDELIGEQPIRRELLSGLLARLTILPTWPLRSYRSIDTLPVVGGPPGRFHRHCSQSVGPSRLLSAVKGAADSAPAPLYGLGQLPPCGLRSARQGPRRSTTSSEPDTIRLPSGEYWTTIIKSIPSRQSTTHSNLLSGLAGTVERPTDYALAPVTGTPAPVTGLTDSLPVVGGLLTSSPAIFRSGATSSAGWPHGRRDGGSPPDGPLRHSGIRTTDQSQALRAALH